MAVTLRCAARADALRVGGFVPFTLTDYPGALAAVVFCQGCPWRCGYCHNPHLIAAHGDDERDFARIVDWLGTRRGLLDAVVFSGGEPTAQAGLPAAIAAVRALGFKIGLHTGGAYPRRLAKVLPLVDWVGLDVKAPRAEYECVTGDRGQRRLRIRKPRSRPRLRCRARSSHDGASDADATDRPGAARARARGAWSRRLGVAAVSRGGLRERCSRVERARAERASMRRCSPSCGRTCLRR